MTTAFALSVSELTGVPLERLERLAGGDLSEVLLLRRPDGRLSVAKGGASVATEAAMLRALGAAGVQAPMVEAEHANVLILEHVANDAVFSSRAWTSIGAAVRLLHDRQGEHYGWPVDYRLATVELDNRPATDWPSFWGAQRISSVATVLDRPWRERVERVAVRLPELVPRAPAPALLHGDLWTGNILVNEGELAALIDPACYFGHSEVDLAMLTLFGSPPAAFLDAYGPLESGWEERRIVYQLFPALVHLRLFGASYAAMVDRLLISLGA